MTALDEKAAEAVFQKYKHVKPRLNRAAIGLICSEYEAAKPSEQVGGQKFERYEDAWELTKSIVAEQGHYKDGEPDFLTDCYIVYNGMCDFLISQRKSSHDLKVLEEVRELVLWIDEYINTYCILIYPKKTLSAVTPEEAIRAKLTKALAKLDELMGKK